MQRFTFSFFLLFCRIGSLESAAASENGSVGQRPLGLSGRRRRRSSSSTCSRSGRFWHSDSQSSQVDGFSVSAVGRNGAIQRCRIALRYERHGRCPAVCQWQRRSQAEKVTRELFGSQFQPGEPGEFGKCLWRHSNWISSLKKKIKIKQRGLLVRHFSRRPMFAVVKWRGKKLLPCEKCKLFFFFISRMTTVGCKRKRACGFNQLCIFLC